MNATNRVMNRIVLFIAGAILLTCGAAAAVAGLLGAGDPPVGVQGILTSAEQAGAAAAWSIDVAGVGTVPLVLLIAAAAALILTVLLLVFVFTRRRGGSRNVLEVDAAGGTTTVDRNVADAVLTAPLISRPDVVSARTGAYRVRKTRAIELVVTVQPGASLGAVVTAAESAIRDWDELLGTRVPIMLHLSDRRWRDALRPRTRVR